MFPYNLLSLLPSSVLIPLSGLGLKGRKASRLGLNLPPPIKGPGSIWMHALSVGELLSALPLLEALKGRYPDRPLVFSVATQSGMGIARERLKGKADMLFYMPIDLFWNNVRLIRRLSPAAFLLVETDLWPGLLSLLKAAGVPRVLVNGRISPATLKDCMRFRFAARRLYGNLSLCLMQSGMDKERLSAFLDQEEKIIVTGNIKFDRPSPAMRPQERERWLELTGFGSEDLVWVAGSTHRGEEEIILDVFSRLSPKIKGLRLILAPRRQEDCALALRRASDMGLRAMLRSSLPGAGIDVVVLDTIGELERIYGLAALSFVGGSLVPLGGHNLLEPAGQGSPVLFGPHTENFVEMSEMLISSGGAMRVRDGKELASAVTSLLHDRNRRLEMGEKARHAVQANTGAVGRVLYAVERLMAAEEPGTDQKRPNSVLMDSLITGRGKMSRCKACEIPRGEAYIDVRRNDEG